MLLGSLLSNTDNFIGITYSDVQMLYSLFIDGLLLSLVSCIHCSFLSCSCENIYVQWHLDLLLRRNKCALCQRIVKLIYGYQKTGCVFPFSVVRQNFTKIFWAVSLEPWIVHDPPCCSGLWVCILYGHGFRIKIFLWYLKRGVIFTKDNLARCNW